MQVRIALFCCIIFSNAFALSAGEVYIIRGDARGRPDVAPSRLLWTVETLVMNPGQADSEIRLLEISNGGVLREPATVPIPAERTITLNLAEFIRPLDPLWVIRADIPDHLIVAGFLRVGVSVDVPVPIDHPTAFGKARMPVIRALVPPGQRQIHLGTDLGSRPARLNVGIFNGETTPAFAHIEVRSHCDDRVLQSRTVNVPGNTLLQFPNFMASTEICGLPRDCLRGCIRSGNDGP